MKSSKHSRKRESKTRSAKKKSSKGKVYTAANQKLVAENLMPVEKSPMDEEIKEQTAAEPDVEEEILMDSEEVEEIAEEVSAESEQPEKSAKKHEKKNAKPKKKLTVMQIIAIAVIAVVAVLVIWFIAGRSGTGLFSSTGQIDLLYEEANFGKAPDGTHFSMYDIGSDEFLEKVIAELGDSGKGMAVEDLRKRIEVMPVVDPQPKMETYMPTSYGITVTGFGHGKVLDAVLKVFADDFNSKYSTNDVSRFEVSKDTVADLEYYDVISLLNNKVEVLKNYVNMMKKVSDVQMEWKGDDSFATLYSDIENFDMVYVNDFTAFITENNVYRSPESYTDKLKYDALDRYTTTSRNLAKYNAAINVLNMTDPAMVAYADVPIYSNADGPYMSRTYNGYDSMADKAKGFLESYSSSNKSLQDVQTRINGALNSSVSVSALADSDQMLSQELSVKGSSEGTIKKADEKLNVMTEKYDGLIVTLSDVLKEYNEGKNIGRIDCNVRGISISAIIFMAVVVLIAIAMIVLVVKRKPVYAKEIK